MATYDCQRSIGFTLAGCLLFGLTGGCAAPRFSAPALSIPLQGAGAIAIAPEHFVTNASANEASDDEAPQPDVRSLPMFLGSTGEVVTWRDVLEACAWADVILVGEEHDDGVGHAVQLAIMQDVGSQHPGTALALEMLERDEQILVDDFLDGLIDADDFADLTHSQSWAGKGSWEEWYQPIIEEAKAQGGSIIAANAPRRYVRQARMIGYEGLRTLPPERRQYFALPKSSMDSHYRDRFVALMSEMSAHGEDESASHASVERARASFRSQFLWDSTMADSIARALRGGTKKVVHLVGRFHVGYEGGTVLELRARKPGARMLTIVMGREGSLRLTEEDRNVADIVIYTGARPQPVEEPVEETEEADATGDAEGEPADAVSEAPSPDADDPGSPPTARPIEPDAR